MTWTTITDRLPDADIDVLIYCPQANDPIWMACFDDELQKWIYPSGATCQHVVTHWMELPKPPGESP